MKSGQEGRGYENAVRSQINQVITGYPLLPNFVNLDESLSLRVFFLICKIKVIPTSWGCGRVK